MQRETVSEEFNKIQLTLSTIVRRPLGVLGSEAEFFQLYIYTPALLLS